MFKILNHSVSKPWWPSVGQKWIKNVPQLSSFASWESECAVTLQVM